MKYNFYLLIIVLSMVVLSACAPTQREQANYMNLSVADGQVTEVIEGTPNVVELPTAVPVTSDPDSVVEETKIPEVVELPTATPVRTEAYISPVDREVMQMANRLNISYDDAKYHYIVNDAIQLSGIHNVLSSRYPDSYAGELVKNIGKNSEFVQLFSKPVDETEMLQEAKNYLKEEFLKHLTIGKVKHSLADLERDSLILEQIIREKILYKPIGRLYFHYAVDAPTNSIQLSVTNFRQFSEILKQTDIVFPESVTISNKDNGYTMLYYNPDSMLPISTPIAPDAYPPPGTPFPTPIPWWENDQLFVEMSERFQIPYDELKYYLLINNRIVYSDLSHAFATQYYGNYAGVSTEYEAFVLLFSKTMNEEELLQEARKYIEEDLIKYIKIRKVDYSLTELKYDEYLLEKIIGTQLMFQPIIEFYAGYGIDAPSNRVMLLVTDIEQFNSMLSQTDIVLPKSVVIVEVEGFVRQPSDTIVLPIPTSIPQTIDG